MKAKTIVLTLVLCLVTATVCLASTTSHMGTWKLNVAKSKLVGAPKNSTVVYEAAGDNVKVTVDGTDRGGSLRTTSGRKVRRQRLPRHRRSV